MSSLKGIHFIEPQEVSQPTITAKKRNIPWSENVDRWPHLKQLHVLHISAVIELLIGTNVPKTIQPEEVIKSRNKRKSNIHFITQDN